MNEDRKRAFPVSFQTSAFQLVGKMKRLSSAVGQSADPLRARLCCHFPHLLGAPEDLSKAGHLADSGRASDDAGTDDSDPRGKK